MRSMHRYALFLLAALAWHPAAHAFDCGVREPKPDLVFEGTVVRHKVHTFERDPAIGDRDDVTFTLSRPVEGVSGNEITVYTALWFEDAYPFFCGKKYRVHAVKKPDGWHTGYCNHNTPLSPGTQDITDVEQVLGREPPAPKKEQEAMFNALYGCH